MRRKGVVVPEAAEVVSEVEGVDSGRHQVSPKRFSDLFLWLERILYCKSPAPHMLEETGIFVLRGRRGAYVLRLTLG